MSGEVVRVRIRRAVLAAALATAVAVAAFSGSAAAGLQEHFLDYSEDNYKVVFISGNLTAAMTRDWPRVVFQHSTDMFSPTFEVSLPSIYLYNDTDGDGLFALSEATYTAYMDWNHVTWNVTSVEFGNDTEAGEYAHFRMMTTLSLYQGLDNQTVDVPDWANITFTFRMTERSVNYTNSHGTYVVKGRTELGLNFSMHILKWANTSGVVLGQKLQGGASTYMFLISEAGSEDDPASYTEVSGREDDTDRGLNFTRRFNHSALPEQQLFYSQEDRTIQAFYHFSSEPTAGPGADGPPLRMNSSYLTTGTGLMLHNSYGITNETEWISHDADLGIVESGFVRKVRDWLWDNLPWIVGMSGAALVAVAGITLLVLRYRKDNRV